MKNICLHVMFVVKKFEIAKHGALNLNCPNIATIISIWQAICMYTIYILT